MNSTAGRLERNWDELTQGVRFGFFYSVVESQLSCAATCRK